MRFLLGLVLILALAAGGAYVVAGRMAGPPIQIVKPEKIRRRSPRRSRSRVDGAGRRDLETLRDRPRAERQADAALHARRPERRPGHAGRRPTSCSSAARSASRRAGPQVRRGAHHRDRGPPGAARHPHGRSRRPRRDVQVRLERPRVSVVSTHHYVNLGGIRDGRLSRRRPEDVESGRGGRRRRVSGLPGDGRRGRRRQDHRSRRCASRSSRCSTTRTSTRRCASSRATRPATRRAPTSTSARSRSRSSAAASSSTTSCSTASCRRSSKARPR